MYTEPGRGHSNTYTDFVSTKCLSFPRITFSFPQNNISFPQNNIPCEFLFILKIIRREHKQRRDGEACRASLINLISKVTNMVFYLSCIITYRASKNQKAKSRKHYDVSWRRPVTNRTFLSRSTSVCSQSSSESASKGVA